MNKKTLKIVLAIVAVVAAGLIAYFLISGSKAKADGTVEITVQDLNGKVLADKKIDFYEGDTVVKLVEANFANVTITNGMLMTIESLTTPEDWSTFISILVNGEMSMVGIEEMTLNNGDKIDFVDTVLSY